MEFFPLLVAFGFGSISTIVALIAIFYLVLLKQIARNERYMKENTLNYWQSTSQAHSSAGNSSDLGATQGNENGENQPAVVNTPNQTRNEPASIPPADKTSNKGKLRDKIVTTPEDPIHRLVKTKSKDSKKSSRSSSLSSDKIASSSLPLEEVLRSGWVKIRGSLKVWWNRWAVVRPGRVVYYRNDNREDCFGILLLQGCFVSEVPSKKGFSLRIWNPDGKSVYSSKGLRGESLSSMKFPGKLDECILRLPTESERLEWMKVLCEAINLAPTNVEPDRFLLPAGPSSGNLGVPESGVASGSSSGTTTPGSFPEPVMNPAEMAEKVTTKLSQLPAKSSEFPEKGESKDQNSEKDEVGSVGSAEESLTPRGKAKDKDNRSQDSHEWVSEEEESDEEDELSLSTSSPPSGSSTVPAITLSTPSDPTTTATVVMEEVPSLSSVGDGGGGGALLQSLQEAVEEEGWMDLKIGPGKTAKDFKEFFFLLRNGLLMFFLSEKSSDCEGLVDLEGCQFVQTGVLLEISHPSKKPILLLVNGPTESGNDLPSDLSLSLVTLRTQTEAEAQMWLKGLTNQLGQGGVPVRLPRKEAVEGRAEKCHWFNAFMTRYFADLQHSKVLRFLAMRTIGRRFERIRRPDYIVSLSQFFETSEETKNSPKGPIQVMDIELGKEMVTFQELFMVPTDIPNELMGEAEIRYTGGASLTLSTEFYVNFPRHHFATIPVVAYVKVMSLEGRLLLYGPPERNSPFSLCFTTLPKCHFNVNLKVGGKYEVSKFSKVSDFIVSNLKKILWKNCVAPNRITFSLPLPQKKMQIGTKQLTSKRKQRSSESAQTQ